MPSESTTALGNYHRAFWVSQYFQKSCFPTIAYCIFCDMSQFTTPPPLPPHPHPLSGAQIRSIPGMNQLEIGPVQMACNTTAKPACGNLTPIIVTVSTAVPGTPLRWSHRLTQRVHTTIQKNGDVCTDQSTKMAWSRTGPALRKEQQMTGWEYISGSGDKLGSAEPTVTTTSNTTP